MDFMKVIDQTVREIKREVNLKVLKVPEIEQKVLDATDNEPWGPHGSALAEIANATKKFTDCPMVMNVLWTRLTETGRDWRHVYKALAVIEYLVANGSERAVDDIIEHTYQISSLSGFEYAEPNGKDMGINVRKKVETILSLLNDNNKIQEVRKKAAANREKYFGLSSSGITYKSSSTSHSSSNFQSTNRYGLGDAKEGDMFKDSYKGRDRYGEDNFGKDTYDKSHTGFADENQEGALKKGSVYNGSGGGLVAYSESTSDDGTHNVKSSQVEHKKKRVIVLGTGWAGMSFLKDVDSSSFDVQVVSPCNYFAFTPLLPSVTNGTVEARSIVEPIRNIMKKKNGEIQFWEAECIKIDAASKKVVCRSHHDTKLAGKEEFILEYDYLVIAIGAQVNTFNTSGVMEYCHFLKEIEDAQRIRRSVIDCFEKAVLPNLSEEEKRNNLHFVIVGGGPTGVEFAASLHDFIHEDLVNIYPMVQDLVKITLIQSGDHILNMFDERISSFAEKKFQRDGIELQTGYRVSSVSDRAISMNIKSRGEISSIPYGMVVWSTGIGTRPVIKDFMEQIGQSSRRVLATDEWLRVKDCDHVYALGDCATINQRRIMEDISSIFKAADKDNSGTLTVKEFEDVIEDILVRYPQVDLYLKHEHLQSVTDLLKDPQGNETKEVDIEGFKLALSHVDSQMKSLPATAQVAAQQGAYLARCFNHKEEFKDHPEGPRRFRDAGRHKFLPFRYKHLGQFAPLGGEQAAAELPGDWVSIGRSSQWLWYSVYASKQVSWRTRFLVIFDWTRKSIFGRDSSSI